LKAYSAVVSLLNDAGITGDTDSTTVAQIAESLLRTGNTPKALSILQGRIRSRPQDGPLYLALADCYQQMGDSRQQSEMLRRARSLLAEPSSVN
ncbi:MAG: tetratricopeptide repeat protein, partial [Ktedonobacteraceae bacterium]